MNFFIPGRLCLLGEHSDWAAVYRLVNPNLKPGYAIVVGTNQGVYADVEPNSHLVFKTIHCSQVLELAMEEELLLAMAPGQTHLKLSDYDESIKKQIKVKKEDW